MKTVIGLFDDFSQAEAAVRDLEASGIGRDSISVVRKGDGGTGSRGSSSSGGDVSAGEGAAIGAGTGAAVGGGAGLLAAMAGLTIPGLGPALGIGALAATVLGGAGIGAASGGLMGALVNSGVPEQHANYYTEGVRRGGTLVTVSADDEMARTATAILNRHNPVDIEDRAASWSTTEVATPAMANSTYVGGETTRVGGETARVGGETTVRSAAAARPAEGETRLEVVEEELQVGKREVERGGVRVSTHVEERQVEEQVNLREEHVRVERRPVDRPATGADLNRAFQEQTIELTERAEVPVVSKEARVVEEVVVGKEATQHTETIRDTVRRTDVDVEQVAGSASGGDFDRYENDFRQNYQSSGRGEYAWDDVKPAYRFGYDLAGDRRSGDWNAVESDARQRWEQRSPGTWEKVKDAARYAYDRARSKTS